MVTCSTSTKSLANLKQPLHKTEQSDSKFPEQENHRGSLLLSILKPLETQLQKRKLLRNCSTGKDTPLWFTAITERNVFLWRKGFSLRDQDRFEFWILPEKLVEKRLEQLQLIKSGDLQLLSGISGTPVLDAADILREQEYLLCFLDVYQRITSQALILSQLQLRIEEELIPHQQKRTPIYLPMRTISMVRASV